MAAIIKALDELATKAWHKEWANPAWKQFILSGDESHLKKIPKLETTAWLPGELLLALGHPATLDESGKRFLTACLKLDHPGAIGSWIGHVTTHNPADAEVFHRAQAVAVELGCPSKRLASELIRHVRLLDLTDRSTTAAGRHLLQVDDGVLEHLLRDHCTNGIDSSVIALLFSTHAPNRWLQQLERLKTADVFPELHFNVWIWPMELAPSMFLEVSATAFERLTLWDSRFEIGKRLHTAAPERFVAAMEKLAVTQLVAVDSRRQVNLGEQSRQSGAWLARHRARAQFPLLQRYFALELSGAWHIRFQSDYKIENLEIAVQTLGRDAIPLLDSCFATSQPEVQLKALKFWAGIKSSEDTEAIAKNLRILFAEEDGSVLSRAVRLSGDIALEAMENDLWPLLAHKSKPVREAAAVTLAKLGESRLPKTKELWAIRRADARIAAVAWLKAIGTPAAAAALKTRLDTEEDDNVRDAILLALEKLQGGTVALSPKEFAERIQKTLQKVKDSPVPWLDPKKLPMPRLRDGSTLPVDSLLYLLYRQSRVKEMRADIEAKPLYQQIDRKTSGDLALAVVQAFFASKGDADDRWTMAFAAIVGDDRLVPVLTRQTKEWADNMRGKLAEYAVQSLALMGSDSALLAVDAMAIRYRAKNKNIGKAASEAFAEAAQARGLTVEELGDLVVPWLGFPPGQPRLIATGKATVEVRITEDFKLAFRDVATNKKVAKLPDSIPAELKAEFKEMTASLKEAVKSQLLRMETLMVRQFRWPMKRWQELYLQHPLLLPFAQRLVWATYDDTGKLTGTFRILEDHSATDAQDEAVKLPNGGQVGVVHPLELDAALRQQWITHLADYEVVPPFAQMERPVIKVATGTEKTKFGDEVLNTKLNGITFKGRAERLGWARGSVCDAGCINYYLKSFPATGVDVFVETEGMYVGIDMYSEITLGKVFFVKHGSVQIGSYVYDEPSDADDARLLAYQDVPVIAFSEAMGDLAKIAGKSTSAVEADDSTN
ncbi:MAG TPA: DUF4132 domain-containing protein [Verrucomicrobiae bacterium]